MTERTRGVKYNLGTKEIPRAGGMQEIQTANAVDAGDNVSFVSYRTNQVFNPTEGGMSFQFNEITPFTGVKTRNGKETKTYQKWKLENYTKVGFKPDKVENKVINPETGRFTKINNYVDMRTKDKKGKKGFEVINNRVVAKPTSKSVFNFTTTEGKSPQLKDIGLDRKTTGLYFIKIFRDNQLYGHAQIDFKATNKNVNQVDLFNAFNFDSGTSYLEEDTDYRIEVYRFDDVPFTRENATQIYANNIQGTCVIDGVISVISQKKDSKTKDDILFKCERLKKKFPTGMSIDDIQVKICNSMKFKVNIYAPTIMDKDKPTYELSPKGDKHKYLLELKNTRLNHAQEWNMNIYNMPKDHIIYETQKEMVKRFKLCENANMEFIYKNSSRIQGNNPVCEIMTQNKLYKLEDPLLDDKDMLFEEYDDVFIPMRTSFKEYERSMIKFIQQATYVNGMCSFNLEGARCNMQEHDVEKAYATFNRCKYYKDYGIPAIPTDFMECEGQDALNVISKYGWTQIKNIKIDMAINSHRLANLQENYVYPNVELKCLYDKGVRFDVINTCWSITKKDFEFPEYMMEKIDHPDYVKYKKDGTTIKQSKYALFIGMLLQTNPNQRIMFRYAEDPAQTWLDNATYEDPSIKRIYHNQEMKTLIFEKEKQSIHSYNYISSYITAYVRTRMYDEIDKYDKDDIFMVKSDAIKFRGDYELPEGFKVKTESIWLSDTNFCDFHNDKEVNLDWDTDAFEDLPQFVFLNGAGGCGKTTKFINKKFPYSALTFPTHELKADKQKETKYNCYTHCSFFQLPVPKKEEEEEKTAHGLKNKADYHKIRRVLVDEVTMVKPNNLNLMIKHALKYGYRLYVAGDIDWETQTPYQLQPVMSKFKMDISKFQEVKHEKNYRIKCKRLSFILQFIRLLMKKNMHQVNPDIINQLNDVVFDEIKDRFIKEEDALKQYNPKNDIIIAGRWSAVNHFNEELLKTNEGKEKIQLTCNLKDYSKGQIIYKPDLTTTTKSFKICFSTTIHGVQGKTFMGNLYIHKKNIFEFGMLYTALSRVRHYNQIYIID